MNFENLLTLAIKTNSLSDKVILYPIFLLSDASQMILMS